MQNINRFDEYLPVGNYDREFGAHIKNISGLKQNPAQIKAQFKFDPY